MLRASKSPAFENFHRKLSIGSVMEGVYMNITIDGISIHYTAKGEGSNIILLHGWGSNIGLFKPLIEGLSQKHTVYALDMPGFGESDEPKEPWCVDQYVDFVCKFMKQLNISETAGLGHSFGGRVLIKLANREQKEVRLTRLVLVDSAGIRPKQSLKKKMRVRMFKLAKKLFSLSLMKKLYPDFIENMRKSSGSADYNAASPLMRQTLVKVINEDLTPLLSGIKQPALLVWGELDQDTPLSDGRKMEQLIPDSGLVVVKGAGHYSYLEQSGFVLRVLDSFLN